MTHRTRALAAPLDEGRPGLSWIGFVATMALLVPAGVTAQSGFAAGPVPAAVPEATRLTGIADVRSMEAIMPELRGPISQAGGTLYATLAAGNPCAGAALCAPALIELGLEDEKVEDVGQLVAGLRLVKDAEELRRLRHAMDITAEAQLEAMRVLEPGMHEYEIEPGMVLTIEPGLYIASEKIGVRIEDDILVTVDGHELLSTAAPRSASEVERVLAERRQKQ